MKKIYTVAVIEKCFGFGGWGWAAVLGADRIDALQKEAARLGASIAESAKTGELYVKTVSVSKEADARRIGSEYVKEFMADLKAGRA